jgi:hypothetical protein
MSYLAVAPTIAFPLQLDPFGMPRGLGQPLPVAGIISASMSAINTAISLILNSGCGVTCVETSDWANEAANLLGQNIAAYFALPPPRSQADQQQAIANFNAIWAQLQTNCGQSGTGTAGIKCISDREAGACTWTQDASSSLLAYPGEPQVGQCWNWFNGYLYPIQNDPDVATDLSSEESSTSETTVVATVTNAANSAASSIGLPSGSGTYLLIAAAVLAAFLVIK